MAQPWRSCARLSASSSASTSVGTGRLGSCHRSRGGSATRPCVGIVPSGSGTGSHSRCRLGSALRTCGGMSPPRHVITVVVGSAGPPRRDDRHQSHPITSSGSNSSRTRPNCSTNEMSPWKNQPSTTPTSSPAKNPPRAQRMRSHQCCGIWAFVFIRVVLCLSGIVHGRHRRNDSQPGDPVLSLQAYSSRLSKKWRIAPDRGMEALTAVLPRWCCRVRPNRRWQSHRAEAAHRVGPLRRDRSMPLGHPSDLPCRGPICRVAPLDAVIQGEAVDPLANPVLLEADPGLHVV